MCWGVAVADVVIAATSLSSDLIDRANKISAVWRKAAASIIETGSLLIDAEQALNFDEYRRLVNYLVESEGMSASVISKLRMIARNPVLTKPENIGLLPPSYATLYRMTNADEDKLQEAFDAGTISPEVQLRDVEKLFFKKAPKPKAKIKVRTVIEIEACLADLPQEVQQQLPDAISTIQSRTKVKIREVKWPSTTKILAFYQRLLWRCYVHLPR